MAENDKSIAGLDPLKREALAWVVRLKSGEATVADAEALARWRAEHPDRDAAFREAARIWQLLGPAAVAVARSTGHQATRSPLLARRAVVGGALAASVVAAAALVRPPLDLWPSLSELAADVRTAKGERRRIVVGGDVVIELNTQTSLSRRRSERRIDLLAGEAVVICRHSPNGPFELAAAGGSVAVEDGEFAVRCDDGAVTVTCLSGTVEVQHRAGHVALASGLQTDYSAASISPPAAADPEVATGWISGRLVFKDRPLGEVIAEVNRYRSGHIVVINSAVARRTVNATFHLDRLDDVIAQIQDAFGVSVTTLPGGFVLIG